MEVSKSAQCVANTADPDQMLQNAASDLGLHCLLRPVCPSTQGMYGIVQISQEQMVLYIRAQLFKANDVVS